MAIAVRGSNRTTIIFFVVAAAAVITAFGVGNYKNRNVNSGEICKTLMKMEFNRYASIVDNTNRKSKVKIESDVYGTDFYHCTASSGSVSWGKVNGRMRNTTYDPKVTYFLEGRDMYVRSKYPDGSSRERVAYTLAR